MVSFKMLKMLFDRIGSRIDTVSGKLDTVSTNVLPAFGTPLHKLQSQSIDAGGTVEVTLTPEEIGNYDRIMITVRWTSDSSSTNNGVVVYFLYSPDGVNYDSKEKAAEKLHSIEVSSDSAGTFQYSDYVYPAMPYMKLIVENKDTSYAETVDLWVTPFRL